MNAKEMLLDYAAKNNSGTIYNNEQWLGKAMTEGTRIIRNSEFVVIRIRREAKTIIVTETTTSETVAIADGKTVISKHDHKNEVLRVDL